MRKDSTLRPTSLPTDYSPSQDRGHQCLILDDRNLPRTRRGWR